MAHVKTHPGRPIRGTGNPGHREGFIKAVIASGMTYRLISSLTGVPYARLIHIANHKDSYVLDREREALFSELGVVEELFHPGRCPKTGAPSGFRLTGDTHSNAMPTHAPAANAALESRDIIGLLMQNLRSDRSREIVTSLVNGKSAVAMASEYGITRARVYSIVQEEAARLVKKQGIGELLHNKGNEANAAK